MSFADKHHRIGRGSMQGQCRYPDITGDASSVGGFMDETDREVSSLTDRAFRSLCMGEEAIYNDSELTSPAERRKAFAEETVAVQEMFSAGEGWGKAGGKPALATTFQCSSVQMGRQQHVLQHRSCLSNGAIESTWQQRRSRSRVSSLIQAFSSTGTGHGITPLQDGRHSAGTGTRLMNSEPWDRSGLPSLHNELPGLPATQPQDTSLAGNYFYSSSTDPTVTAPKSKTSTSRLRKLSSTNFFLHSEFSPFQTWKEYSKFQHQQDSVVNPVAHGGVPRWYDSPLYKELTAANAMQVTLPEEKKCYQKQNEHRMPSEPPESSVLQKALAIEKRCESEMTSNCPPWRRSRTLLNGQLPMNRPCTASPCSEKHGHQDEALLSACQASAIYHKVHTLVDETADSSASFNISQLLTPVIHARQETETSEIVQDECSPSHEPLVPKDADPRMQHEVKQRDNYKAMASSLLFNLKDNRKRVKSTYSPTKFKSQESGQPSKQDSSSPTAQRSISGVYGSGTLQVGAADGHSGNGPVLQPTIRYTAANVSDEYLTLISPPTIKEAPHDGSFSKAVKGDDELSGSQKSQYGGSSSALLKSSEIPVNNKFSQPTQKQQKASPARQDAINSFPREGPLHSIPAKENAQGGTTAVNEDNFIRNDVIDGTENIDNKMTVQAFHSGHQAQVKRNNTKVEAFALSSGGKKKTAHSFMKGEEVAARECDILSQPEMQGSSNASQAGTVEMNEKCGAMAEPYVSLGRDNVTPGLLPAKQTERCTTKVAETAERGHVRKELLKFRSSEASRGGPEKNQPVAHSRNAGAANKGRELNEYSPNETHTVRENSQATKRVHIVTAPSEAPTDSLCKRESGAGKQEPGVEGVAAEDRQHGIEQGLSLKRDATYNQNDAIDFKDEQSEATQCLLYAGTDQPLSHQAGAAKKNRFGKARTLPREECSWPHQSLEIRVQSAEFASAKEEVKATGGKASATEQEGETKGVNSTLGNPQGIDKAPANKTHERPKGERPPALALEEICQAAVQNEIVQTEAMKEGKGNSFKASVSKEPDKTEKEAPAISASQSAGHAMFMSKGNDQLKHTYAKKQERQSGVANKADPKVKHKKFSFNERDYAMHEILTSKIKAHAQKEIFAIMEKGYAKWEAIAASEKEPGAKRSLFGGRGRSNDHCSTKLEAMPRGEEKGDTNKAPPTNERERNSKESVATDDGLAAKNGHPVTKDTGDGKNEPARIDTIVGGQCILSARGNLHAQDVSNTVTDSRSAKPHDLAGTEKGDTNDRKEPRADPKSAGNKHQHRSNERAKAENSERNPKRHLDAALEQKSKSSPRQQSREKERIGNANASIHKSPDANRETERAESAVLKNNVKDRLQSGKTEYEDAEETDEATKVDEGCPSKRATPTKGKREDAGINKGGISPEAHSLRGTGSVRNGCLKVKNKGDGTDLTEESREHRKGEELLVEKTGDKKEVLATIEKEFVKINVFAITRNADTGADVRGDTKDKHRVEEKRPREQGAAAHRDDSGTEPQIKRTEELSKQAKSEDAAKGSAERESAPERIRAASGALATTDAREQLEKEHGVREAHGSATENAKPLAPTEQGLSTRLVSTTNGVAESFGEGDEPTDEKGKPATEESERDCIVTRERMKTEATAENRSINSNASATKKHDGSSPLAKQQRGYPELLENQGRIEPDAPLDKEYVDGQMLPSDEPRKGERPSVTENPKVFNHNKPIKDPRLKNPKSGAPGAKKHPDIGVSGAKEEANSRAVTARKSCSRAVQGGDEATKSELSAAQSRGNAGSNDGSDVAAKECNESDVLSSPEEEPLARQNFTPDVFATSEATARDGGTNPDPLEGRERSKPAVLVQNATAAPGVPARKEDVDPSLPLTADQRVTDGQIKSEAPVLKDHAADAPATAEPLKPRAPIGKGCERSVPVTKDVPVTAEPVHPSLSSGNEFKQRAPVTREDSKPVPVPVAAEVPKPTAPTRKECTGQGAPVTNGITKPDIPATAEHAKPGPPVRKEPVTQSAPVAKEYSRRDVPAAAETSELGVLRGREVIKRCASLTTDIGTPEGAEPSKPPLSVRKRSAPVAKEHGGADASVTTTTSKPALGVPDERIGPNVPMAAHSVKTEEPRRDVATRKEHAEGRPSTTTGGAEPGLPLPKEITAMKQPTNKEHRAPEERGVSAPARSGGLPAPEERGRRGSVNGKSGAFPLKGDPEGEVKNEHLSRKDATLAPARPGTASEGGGVPYKRAFAPKERAESNEEVLTDKEGDIYAQRYKEQEALALQRKQLKEQSTANEDGRCLEKDIPRAQRHAETGKGQRAVKERRTLAQEVRTSSEGEKAGRAAQSDAKRKAASLSGRSSLLPLQVNGRNESSGYLEQPVHTDTSTKPLAEPYLSMEGAHRSLTKEPKMHVVLENVQPAPDGRSSVRDGKESKSNKEIEGLEYYALSNRKTGTGNKRGRVPLPQTDEKMPRRRGTQTSGSDADESRWSHNSADSVKDWAPTPQSDPLSPTMGKPTMFKVKDNTFRISPVTKTVKPRFHKTFPEDLQCGSPSSSEKAGEQQDQLAEPPNLPAFHHAAVLSNRFPRARERMSHHVLSPSDFGTAEEGGGFRRNPVPEEDECCSVASVFSEDAESHAPSTVDVADDRVAVLRDTEDAADIGDTAERPEVRPLGKPPVVPPKTEKALRRAQKLTSRRVKKAEANVGQEGKSHVDQKAVRAVSSVPCSPTGLMESHHPMPGPPPGPTFCIETGYVAPAPSLVPQPFPLTQRKLLQDPNSGQYFVVDMPVQVKTKMFFDPETGKYVQLSVRQSPEGTLSPASSVELLNPPYMLYPGFLPVHVPSLPPLRSSSQMSAPAALVGGPERPDFGEPWIRKGCQHRTNSEARPYIEPVYRPSRQLLEESSHGGGKNAVSPRNMNIISMSELEDFAVENT